jgi:hypothetical protein
MSSNCKRTDAIIVSMLKLQVIMAQRLSIASMNHGGWNFDFGKLKYVNAIHSSSFPTAVTAGIQVVC